MSDQLALLAQIVEATTCLVVVTRRDGGIEWANPAFAARTGYALHEAVGRSIFEMLQGPDTAPAVVQRLTAWTQEGRAFRAEVQQYTRSGEPFWTTLHVTPLRGPSAHADRLAWVQLDTTHQRKLRSELEDARARSESAKAAQEQFLSTLGQEMRTPLNVLLGSVDLALATAAADDPELHGHLRRISDTADEMLRLVGDTMDVAGVGTTESHVVRIPVTLRDCCRQALRPSAARAREKGVRFSVAFDHQLPDAILSDPERLEHLFGHLASHAVKTAPSNQVSVRAQRTDAPDLPSGEGLEVTITAVGHKRSPGAAAGPDAAREGDDFGFGLVRGLVDALGGTFAVHQLPGYGTEFRVTVPLELVPEGRPRPSAPRVASTYHEAPDTSITAHILVAEDSDSSFGLLQLFLTKSGYHVTRARNGRQAVDLARDADLILMDLDMPVMNGIEATERIRAAEADAGREAMPILALTSHTASVYREQCLSAGCTNYLTKPIRRQALLEAISEALKLTRRVVPPAPVKSSPPPPIVQQALPPVPAPAPLPPRPQLSSIAAPIDPGSNDALPDEVGKWLDTIDW